MQRSDAIDQLPIPYAVAIRLLDAGVEPSVIGVGLGIPAESLSAFVDLANRKLAGMLEKDSPPAAPGEVLTYTAPISDQ